MKLHPFLAISIAAFSVSFSTQAQQYYQNQFFGINGRKQINFPNAGLEANSLVLLPNGKLIVGSGGLDGAGDAHIKTSRLSINCGGIDSSYGTGGITYYNYVLRNVMNDFVVQPDGKLVGVGYEATSNASSVIRPAVYRINANGTPDSTFNGDGHWAGPFSATQTVGELFNVRVFPDGRIQVLGTGGGGGAMRFKPNGTLDSSFGTNGQFLTDLNVGNVRYGPNGIVAPDKSLLYSINEEVGGNTYVLNLFRLDSLGQFDSSFGTAGRIRMADFQNGSARSHLSYQAGKAIVAFNGGVGQGNERLDLMRLKSNGTLDSTFGLNGFARYRGNGAFTAYSVTVLADNKILITGRDDWPGVGNRAALARFNANGSVDTTFGTRGLIRHDNPNFGGEFFTRALIMPDSSLFAVGSGQGLFVVKYSPRSNTKWVNLGADRSVCAGTAITLDARNTGSSFLWTNNATTQTLSPTTSGSYGVRVSDAAGCQQSDTVRVTFNPLPSTPTITRSGNMLNTSATGSLQWFLGGNPIQGATGSSVSITASGAYTVTITVAGCSATSTPFNAVVSIRDAIAAGISIGPNPIRDALRISWSEVKGGWQAKLVNSAGQVVLSQESGTHAATLPIRDLPNGLYLLRLTSGHASYTVNVVKH